jgi:hypothetical protein
LYYLTVAPNYLRELIPPTVQSTTTYPLRNGSDLIIPFCRLSITTESFIPSTVRLWNRLDQSDRNLQVWLNNTLHNYPIFHRHIEKFGGYTKYSFSRFCLLNLYFNFRSIPKCLDTFKIMFSMLQMILP